MQCTSLVDVITNEGLSRLGEAVLSLAQDDSAAALLSLATTEELPEDKTITLFAPENTAWSQPASLPSGQALLSVLLGHVVPAYLPSSAVIEAVSSNSVASVDTLAKTPVRARLVCPDPCLAAEFILCNQRNLLAFSIPTRPGTRSAG